MLHGSLTGPRRGRGLSCLRVLWFQGLGFRGLGFRRVDRVSGFRVTLPVRDFGLCLQGLGFRAWDVVLCFVGALSAGCRGVSGRP